MIANTNTSNEVVPGQATHDEFVEWFEKERANGLVDIKFAITNSMSDNAVTRVVLHNVLSSERMISAGIVEPHLEG
ncbi:MAG: hypothetical protein GXP22_05980 [Gammaproteobacteria bacterium]|nr:hypothetical protein [Gammaproteobacteria bacterium]